MTVCVVCKKEVIWEEVIEDCDYMFEQADSFGMESLTENQQMVVEGKVCSFNCYEQMD